MAATAEIIFGEPRSVDGFEGGGHSKSAEALVDGITKIADKPLVDADGRENKHLGGAIGLEGAWGSGKSTVIELASKALGPKFHVFSFDLWRHQSDDFRRALLEEFLDYLKELPDQDGLKIDKGVLQTERDAIRDRQTITTTTSKRRYTFIGLLAIILLPFLPLIYSWAQPSAFSAASRIAPATPSGINALPPSLPIDPIWALWALLIYAAAFPIAAALFYWWQPREDRIEERNRDTGTWKWLRWFTVGASRFLTLSSKDKSSTDRKTIRDEDPTTVEFQTVFERIIKLVQGQNGHRVVFVLDNVDRLPEQDVQRAWSDMRALISKSGKDKSASVIAVIPYDRNQVAQAFPPLKVIKPTGDQTALAPAENGEAADIVVESDVFEKTFDRIVKVSAPVPSNWKAFLFATIKRAFGEQLTPDATEKLFRLLKYKLELEGVHPTPRRIISYVNDIGGLWVSWGDTGMPVSTIGLYVLHRPIFDRDPKLLSKANPVDVRFRRIVDDEHYARNLAALAFNVDPKFADQVRLGQPILAGLKAKDGPEQLKTLSQNEGFFELFPDELRTHLADWSVDSPESIARAAINVDGMDLPAELDGAIWQTFADAVEAISTLEYEQAELEGLYTIVRRQKRMSPAAFARRLRTQFEREESSTGEKGFKEGTQWYRMMLGLGSAIGKDREDPERRRFWHTTIPSESPDFNLGVISSHHQVNRVDFSSVDFGCTDQELSDVMIAMMKVNPDGYEHAIRVVGNRIPSFLSAHLDEIAALLDSQEPDDRTIRLLHAVAEIMRYSAPETMRNAFVNIAEGSLLSYLEWAFANGTTDDQAVAVYVAVSANKGAKVAASRGATHAAQAERYNDIIEGSRFDYEILEYLVVHIEAACHASTWIGWAIDSTDEDGLYHRVLQTMVHSPAIRLRNFSMIADHYATIMSILEDNEVEFFLRQFDGREEEIKKQFGDLSGVTVPPQMIEAIAKMDDGASARVILSLVEERLMNLTSEEWHASLADPLNADIVLVASMSEYCGLELRSPEFIKGLVEMAIDVIEGRLKPHAVGEIWPRVQRSIPLSQYTPLRAQVVARMRSAAISAAGALALVKQMGTLANKMRFSVDPSTADMALTQFLWHLANAEDEVAAAYLEANAHEVELTLKAASSDDVRNAYLEARTNKEGEER